MTLVLSEVKKQHGYFIESKSAKNTVVPALTTDMDIPYAQVLEHIDKKTSAAIAAEIRRIGAIAQVNGDVVVAVSASKQVCDAIVALRPWFRQNGIRLTFASEIAKKEKESN
jgi:polysaccharide deacetylase 2 family uncharacterized protein YibQ